MRHAFHSRCGQNIKISNDQRLASRHADTYDHGVTFSNCCIRPGESVFLKVEDIVSKWAGSLVCAENTKYLLLHLSFALFLFLVCFKILLVCFPCHLSFWEMLLANSTCYTTVNYGASYGKPSWKTYCSAIEHKDISCCFRLAWRCNEIAMICNEVHLSSVAIRSLRVGKQAELVKALVSPIGHLWAVTHTQMPFVNVIKYGG